MIKPNNPKKKRINIRKEKDPLRLIELIYKDVFDTNDRVKEIESQQKEFTRLMVEFLRIYKNISDLEDRLFKDIRANELRKPLP